MADYDTVVCGQEPLAGVQGHIDAVIDISLVNRPTFLAECVGQLAGEVRPLLVSNSQYPLA